MFVSFLGIIVYLSHIVNTDLIDDAIENKALIAKWVRNSHMV